ncbi:MAG: hypothetical protein GOMPHAMPRED_008024 [Gomphillus americanus]|uniref:Uncharacterized protein n=1 Tax=Gomphillus americanus TaxID=1940652 RepID=A0A8H3IHF5_9LECA|nr:MAG: hypothetical protein GOMPHAMPRED_008024 [Gomphillus americanus]
MYALSEIAESNDKITIALRENVGRQLYRWTLLESQAFRNGHNTVLDRFYEPRYLAHGQEFPENVLHELLNDTNKQARSVAVGSIISQKRLCPKPLVWKAIVDLLVDPSHDLNVLQHTLEVMAMNALYLPEEVVHALLPLLRHSLKAISHRTVEVLAKVNKLPPEATNTLLSIIKLGSHLHIISASFFNDFLQHLPPLFQNSLIELISQVDNEDKNRHHFVAHVLRELCNQKISSGKILQALVLLMNHENYQTRLDAILAVAYRILPEEIQLSLCQLLKKSDSCIQEAACAVLGSWRYLSVPGVLSQNSINFFIEMMKECDTSTHVLAVKVLSSQTLSETQLTVLHTLLKQGDNELRKLILSILRWCRDLPGDMLGTLLSIMATGDEEHFEACADVIRYQHCLGAQTAMTIRQWLASSSPRLQTTAATACISVVGGLPENVSAQLIKIIFDKHDSTNPKAGTTSAHVSASRLCNDGVPYKSDVRERYDARIPAIRALMGQNQPQQLFYACMQWLYDKDPRLHEVSKEVIAYKAYRSPKMWPTLLNLLHQCPHPQYLNDTEMRDCNATIRAMLETVAHRSSDELMSELVPIAIEFLSQPWKLVQKTGARILRKARGLSLQMIQTLTDIWSSKVHNPRDIRWKKSVFGLHEWYVNVLELQTALPRKTISSLVLLFARECTYESSLDSGLDVYVSIPKRAWMLRSIARMLIDQMSQGNLESSIIVSLIQMSSLDTRKVILMELVIQNVEHKLVSSFHNEILETLCIVYLRRASVAEVCCYHRPDSLYICKDHKEMKLDLNPEQQDNFVRILARVKSECGYADASGGRALGVDY